MAALSGSVSRSADAKVTCAMIVAPPQLTTFLSAIVTSASKRAV
jgi:hypothetical protein